MDILEKARDRSRVARETAAHAIAPESRGPSRMAFGAVGALLGVGAAYLLDPQRGRARRAMLADRLTHLGRQAADGMRRGSSSIVREGRDLASQATHRGGGEIMPNDSALSDKVESELFADATIPKGKININVEEGVVVLRGEVDGPGQIDELRRKAERIPGVMRVDSLLHLPGESAPAEPPRKHATVTTAGPEGRLP